MNQKIDSIHLSQLNYLNENQISMNRLLPLNGMLGCLIEIKDAFHCNGQNLAMEAFDYISEATITIKTRGV